jgi:putative transposase
LDEIYLRIAGRMVYLWRGVDAEGDVLDVLVQSNRNKPAALKLMRKLLKKYGLAPDRATADNLPSYAAAARELGIECRHQTDGWANNRVENSHQPTRRRERKMHVSRARALRRNSSQPTPPSTTLSTSNAISRQLNHTACYAPRR